MKSQKEYLMRQYLIRKVRRRMAKAQMAVEGIQHPCRQVYKPGEVRFGNAVPGGKTSWFAANWERYAEKRQVMLSPKTGKRTRRKGMRHGAAVV